MKNEDIPALIRELRQRLNLTQKQFEEQFAQQVGGTSSTVNHWGENGKRVPLPFLVRRLVEMKEELDSRDAKPPGKKTLVTTKDDSNLAPGDIAYAIRAASERVARRGGPCLTTYVRA